MGFFRRNTPPQSPVVDSIPAISQERIKALFDKEKWNYFVDNEGDLGGTWDSNQYFFLLRGHNQEILHITARWHATVAFERLENVREFINSWNRDRIWPKTFHRIDDDGRIYIMAEHTVDFEHGATNEQLMQAIHTALGTSTQFFEACENELTA